MEINTKGEEYLRREYGMSNHEANWVTMDHFIRKNHCRALLRVSRYQEKTNAVIKNHMTRVENCLRRSGITLKDFAEKDAEYFVNNCRWIGPSLIYYVTVYQEILRDEIERSLFAEREWDD